MNRDILSHNPAVNEETMKGGLSVREVGNGE